MFFQSLKKNKQRIISNNSVKGAYYLCVRFFVNGPIQLDIFYNKTKENQLSMDQIFNQTQNHQQVEIHYQPVQQHTENLNSNQQSPVTYVTAQPNQMPHSNQNSPFKQPAEDIQNQNEFDEFEQDQAIQKIRQQQLRIQNYLAQKSQRQWEQKQNRRQLGKKQLQDYNVKKEQEKEQKAAENIRKEAENKEKYVKINLEAGWQKVISNINLKQGEHKGPKDISRMREVIMHKRQDDCS